MEISFLNSMMNFLSFFLIMEIDFLDFMMNLESICAKKKVPGTDPKDFINKETESINVWRTVNVYELFGDRTSYVLSYVSRE
jgi:hypothetical protein